MISALLAMLVIFVVAAGTAGLVLLGMEGRGQARVPRLAGTMARAARYLNGERRPPVRWRR